MKKTMYQSNYDDYVIDNNERNSIISRLARYAVKKKKRYVIILVNRIAHLHALSERLDDIPHKLVFGGKKVEERQHAVKKFEKGKIRLIIASRVFQKGVNIKRLDVIINGGATKSANDAIQAFGRGVRLHGDKDGLIYFDLADYDPAPVWKPIFDKEGKPTGRKRKVYHSLHRAANQRRRAFKSTGIPIKDFNWSDESSIKLLYRAGERLLAKTLEKR